MIKKIKNSLSAKVFLWICGLLILCSCLIYGILMFCLPQSYSVVVTDKVSDEIIHLQEELSRTDYEDADPVIEEFCRNNRAAAVLSGDEASKTYGAMQRASSDSNKVMTTALEVFFKDSDTAFTLGITAPVSATKELTRAFIGLLPVLAGIIVIISAAGAFLCSRILVKPVLEISRISKRMANLDMTWECKVNRTDEMGILADSLNTMSKRLSTAMSDLEKANQKLMEDMAHITELSRQRRDFFAAASHELKTPVTILKGQIESMVLGIGIYKDTEKVLPETLKEVENMERLVKEILAVSKMEMDGLSGKKEPVSLPDLVCTVTEDLMPLARERGITVHLENTRDISISGNPFLLEKAVHNIMSNAVRHSPENAEIFVGLSRSALTIANTGTVIPVGELPLLFTPFYRIEKSRNKATGGSGLGLYLVKTILDLHGLRYEIKNTDNAVVFYMYLSDHSGNSNCDDY